MRRLFALLVLTLASCGGEQEAGVPSEPSTPVPDAISARDSGRTFALEVGGETSLRLSSEYLWDEPAVEGAAVELTPVDYIQDPGFSEWLVRGVEPGTATISSLGTPACEGDGCPDEPLRFRVTIAVE